MDLLDLIERVQYKAALIVSGSWQGTSREKLYAELGWESLYDRRWARRLTIFYKIHNGFTPSYLSDHIPKRNVIDISLRNMNTNPPLIRTERYENSFFPDTIKSWKNLNEAKPKPSAQSFKKYLNDFIRPPGHPLFGIRDILGIKLLTKLRVSFSDLRDHRFTHNFCCNIPVCSCGFWGRKLRSFFPTLSALPYSTFLSSQQNIRHTADSIYLEHPLSRTSLYLEQFSLSLGHFH